MEVLLFLGIFGMVAGLTIPLLFSSHENRLRQQTMSTVERSGLQTLQVLVQRVQHAQRILIPPLGGSGARLVLQSSSGALNPTMVFVETGALVLLEGGRRRVLSSPQVAVENLLVVNTSPVDNRPSLSLSLRVSRILRLQVPLTYVRSFETGITLFPDDRPG